MVKPMRAVSFKFSAIRNGSRRFADDERGSQTIFSVFLFILLLMMAGMAVDMIRHEHDRVAMQNTLDTAVLAASSLSQDLEAESVVREYVSKAGLDPDTIQIQTVETTVGNAITGREVTVSSDFALDTMFMDLMGVSSLEGRVGSAANEGEGVLEVVLVLDISGSMNRRSADPNNTKIEALRTAAQRFLTTIFNDVEASRLMVSIVPYNEQVRFDADLYSRLNVANSNQVVSPALPYPGAMTRFDTLHPDARCLTFAEADFQTRRLAASASFTPGAYYADDSRSFRLNGGPAYDVTYDQPADIAFRCGTFFSEVLPYSNNQTALSNHISGLQAEGYTSIHYGMNHAVALLDPSMRTIVNGMVSDSVLPAEMQNRPLNYNDPDVQKIIVMMTDGANTRIRDLKPEFHAGPSRVWYSASAATEYEGYYVLMPDNPANQRWYVPGVPDDNSDDQFLAQGALPADAVQWSYHDVYSRFGYEHVAEYFFKDSGDSAAYDAHRDAARDLPGYSDADRQLKLICDAAKAGNDIEIYAVAFEAPDEGKAALSDCASSDSHYFDVEGLEISTAFDAIATQLTVLKLVR